MQRLLSIKFREDIPEKYLDSPIGRLLEYHNLGHNHQLHSTAELLIGMCMDNRKSLRIADNFAYILRAGGANLRHIEFKFSYAISVGGVRAIALIGHTQCGMVNLVARKDQFIKGLVDNAGWNHDLARQHFESFSPMFEIGDAVDFTLSEAKRIQEKYPKVLVAPLMYKVEDNMLYLVE